MPKRRRKNTLLRRRLRLIETSECKGYASSTLRFEELFNNGGRKPTRTETKPTDTLICLPVTRGRSCGTSTESCRMSIHVSRSSKQNENHVTRGSGGISVGEQISTPYDAAYSNLTLGSFPPTDSMHNYSHIRGLKIKHQRR